MLELAAEKGNACALSTLGWKYKGHDEEKSFHFFQRAVLADQAEFTVSEMQSFDMQSFRSGHADDLYELGKMYRYGRGTGVDEEKCLRFYEQAATLGHGEALDNLGEAYEYGHLGKEVNIETSIKYYEKSVEADPGPWADIIEKYGNVRTFVLGEERGEWTDTGLAKLRQTTSPRTPQVAVLLTLQPLPTSNSNSNGRSRTQGEPTAGVAGGVGVEPPQQTPRRLNFAPLAAPVLIYYINLPLRGRWKTKNTNTKHKHSTQHQVSSVLLQTTHPAFLGKS